ncbi:MAG: putative O-glycosylation ligase, exosortase A system-associated [Burkholderiales bacterium RIFCSPLOWO2_12_FULL_61_40]|nr:MAG: putative O-glycosylation ligase, exosortase A system-associated [Burkholderiales bacterium RIFCSPLOWO2_12_FULL_61_40]
MRDILVLSIVLTILPFAIRHTWVAVLLWTWVSVMNPHKLAFGFAQSAPFAAIAAIAALVSLVANRDRFKFPQSPAVVALTLFVIWMCITTIFAINPGPSWTQLSKILKIQLMTLIAMIALRERKHIEWFLWVNVLSIGFYGLKGGIFTITSGGSQRVWGPPGGFIEGNNEIGLALIMAIPLMNYLRVVSSYRWIRVGLLAMMVLSAIAALGTQSRGAFLAISAMGMVLWTRSNKKFTSAVVISVVAVTLLSFMPSTWETRMRSIENYEQDSSAMGRINAWRMAFNLANDRFFGGGFEVYTPEIFSRYAPVPEDLHAAHSIYFQVLGEHGYIGLALFLLLWLLAFKTAGSIRRDVPRRPETLWLHHLGGMCQVALVGYAVGGAFLSLSYFDLPYNILVVLVVSLRWLQERRWEAEAPGASTPSKPLRRMPVVGRSLQT